VIEAKTRPRPGRRLDFARPDACGVAANDTAIFPA